jgi:uncharacterized protein YecE (DUF72 family)
MVFIGTAGWSIPRRHTARCPGEGTHLQRYGRCLNAVEINTSFYRPHQRKTYQRWAASVPENFRFSVKMPRSISHEKRLRGHEDLLAHFLEDVSGLGRKLAVILVQLPPNLSFDAGHAHAFFRDLRRGCRAGIACEPRHVSWFTPKSDAFLKKMRIARVAADPPRASGNDVPGGWQGLGYWRMHGSPKVYYSEYAAPALKTLAKTLKRGDWCIFDNTAASAALGNALTLKNLTAA